MKAQRKIGRDRAKRESSRSRARDPQKADDPNDDVENVLSDEDLQVARSLMGYDE